MTMYTAGRHLLPILLFAWQISSFAQDHYQYVVDLNTVQEDRVTVELIPPKLKRNQATFYFAKIIPGTYQVYDFGRFISNFQAFDQGGERLEVVRTDENTFRIAGAKNLQRITYQVDDSYDLADGKKVSGMSGTNIESAKNFVLNGHGFYGYFEGMKQLDYEIKILKPEGFQGASAEKPVESNAAYDLYKLPGFNYLVDTPMMYSVPDISTKVIGGAEIQVAVYSPSKNVTSEYLMNRLGDLLEAQKEYMGGTLPVKKYAFIMYFLEPGMDVGTGALEHNYSSLYALPDLPQEQIIQPILNIAAHEFFHVITPLNIHSEEIQYFDFNDPKMSKHLWLYEGVTEYFAHHAQVAEGLVPMEAFLSEMASKITDAKTNYNDSLPFTALSEGCLDPYREEYGNVYQKGALIGFALDIYLREYSQGNTGLMDLLNLLAGKYGPEVPFKDQKLFDEIGKYTHKDIISFFRRHVDGPVPLPLKALFEKIGVAYAEPEPYMGYNLGNAALGYNASTQRIYVVDISGLNGFGKKMGYQVGDELLKINGKELPKSGFQAYFQGITSQLTEGATLSIEVMRKGEVVQLSQPVEKVQLMKPAGLNLIENPSEAQRAFRTQWLQGAR